MKKQTVYGLEVIKRGSKEYLYAENDEAADNACKEYIREMLWAFNADFLAGYTSNGVDAGVIRILQRTSEDANECIYRLVSDDFDRLVEDAIALDGRGHFLSGYDGEETDSADHDLPPGGFVYKTN